MNLISAVVAIDTLIPDVGLYCSEFGLFMKFKCTYLEIYLLVEDVYQTMSTREYM